MSKIVIGEARGKQVKIDLDVLIPSRLLITANSGGGKSYTMRRLIEQAFGKIQIIIIDPEGEFATLREQFEFVLAGKGGDTPADPRSAALLAIKLLELRASCVCDLYEMKMQARHEWVKLFLESLINAPKQLWHPVLVIIDEAHNYCPEKGSGESVALGSMVDFATKGRKRGFCAVWATQRLSKLNKDASAEMLNRLVGPTFEDVDRERAAKLLSVSSDAKSDFMKEIQALDPGNFYAIGRAISKERILVHIGSVKTTHPEIGSKYAATPPPAPEKIQALLPKLADLPKEAEEKAKTEADLRSEIRSLKGQLSQQVKVGAIVDRGTIRESDRVVKALKVALRDAMKIIAKVSAMGFDNTALKPEEVKKVLDAVSQQIVKTAELKISARVQEFERLRRECSNALERMQKLLEGEALEVAVTVKHNEPFSISSSNSGNKPIKQVEVVNGELTGPERKILVALAELLSIGKTHAPKNMVAAWAGYSPIGGAFGNPIGALRTRGLIDYPAPGVVALTDGGRKMIGEYSPPTEQEIWQRIERTCTGPEQKILRALLDNAGDGEISKVDLAEKSGYSPIGGAFGNPIGALRTKGLLDYPRQGFVRAAEWLFIA